MSQEIYNKTVFKRFFEENDPEVMKWAENVLEKITSPGILPVFIKKDGEDFKAYWETVCHIFALTVLYAKQYSEIDTNKILFELFIEGRGLVTDEVDSLEQMQYLFNNYVEEYRKRGTLDIINKEGTILGELLRLIQYKSEEEFIFALLQARDTGWMVGYSSPTWNRTDTVLNVTKGYEMSKSIEDLDAYPLLNPTGVTVVDDIDNDGNPIKAMTFVGNQSVGISSEEDMSKLLPISEDLSYQISVKVKSSTMERQNLRFGVEVFNAAKQPMICKESYGGDETNSFVLEKPEPYYDYNFNQNLLPAFPNVTPATGEMVNNLFFFHQLDGQKFLIDSDMVLTGVLTVSDYKIGVTGFSAMSGREPVIGTFMNYFSLPAMGMVLLWNHKDVPATIKGTFQMKGADPDKYGVVVFRQDDEMHHIIKVVDDKPFYLNNTLQKGQFLSIGVVKKDTSIVNFPIEMSFEVVPSTTIKVPVDFTSLNSKGLLVHGENGEAAPILYTIAKDFADIRFEFTSSDQAGSDGYVTKAYLLMQRINGNTGSSSVKVSPNPTTIDFFSPNLEANDSVTITKEIRIVPLEEGGETVISKFESVTLDPNNSSTLTIYDKEHEIEPNHVLVELFYVVVKTKLVSVGTTRNIDLLVMERDEVDSEERQPVTFDGEFTEVLPPLTEMLTDGSYFFFMGYQQDGSKSLLFEDQVSKGFSYDAEFSATPTELTVKNFNITPTPPAGDDNFNLPACFLWVSDSVTVFDDVKFRISGFDKDKFELVVKEGGEPDSDGNLKAAPIAGIGLKGFAVNLQCKQPGVVEFPQSISLSIIQETEKKVYPIEDMSTFFKVNGEEDVSFYGNILAFNYTNIDNVSILSRNEYDAQVRFTKKNPEPSVGSGGQEFYFLWRGAAQANSGDFPGNFGDYIPAIPTRFKVSVSGANPNSTLPVYWNKSVFLKGGEVSKEDQTYSINIGSEGTGEVEILMFANPLELKAEEDGRETLFIKNADLPENGLLVNIEEIPNIIRTTPADGYLELPMSGVYYDCRSILSRKNRAYAETQKMNFLNGVSLRMQEGMKYFSLNFTQDRSKSNTDVYIYDIKIKPLFLPFYQGNLGEKDVIAAYFKNNSLKENQTVKDFTEEYLVAYNNILGSQEIKPLKQKKVIFKVLSDRGTYLQGTTITILNQNLVTNTNGEAYITLYPGDYSIDVSKSLFMDIEDMLFSVTEDEEDVQIEYIQMQGDIYERKITFLVVDVQGRPLLGAEVGFNGEFKYTDISGNAIFYAFPSETTYPYTVTKDEYYKVEKNILVDDDKIERVEMILIPRYNLTFNVTNATTGVVAGVTITLTSRTKEADGTDKAVAEIRVTDSQGKAVFERILGGDYSYLAEMQNWIPESGNVTVNSDKTVNITFNPMPTYTAVFTVNGVNTYTGESQTLQGSTVSFAGTTKTTDSKGQTSFTMLGGKYDYTVSYDSSYDTISKKAYELYADDNIIVNLPRKTYKTTIKVIGANGQWLNGARITVNGDKQYTQTSSSGIVLDLPSATYLVKASFTEYKDMEKTVVVSTSAQTVTIDMSQILYQLKFNVTEDNGTLSSNALVTIRNSQGASQSASTKNGEAVFNVPRDSWDWTVTKQYFQDVKGTVQPQELPKTENVRLQRKQTDVTFYVYNEDTGSAISGATVKPTGLSSQTTASNGTTAFRMEMGKTYDVDVTVQDFEPQRKTVTVNQDPMPQQRIGISNKTYGANITVVTEKGDPIYRASVSFGSQRGTTNSQGVVYLNNIKSGFYSLDVSASYYQDYSEIKSIQGTDGNFRVVMAYEMTSSYIYLKKEGNSYGNKPVQVEIYDAEGSLWKSESSMQTNSSGTLSVSSPAGGTLNFYAEDSQCVGTGEQSMTSGSSRTLYLWKALIVSYRSSVQTPEISGGVYEIYGTQLRAQGGSRNTSSPSTLSIRFKGHTRLTSIDQWPESFSLKGSSGTTRSDAGSYHSVFYGCSSLSSIAMNVKPSISGGVIMWFYGCTGLRSIPSGLFTNMTGNSCSAAFMNSGITSLPSGQLVPSGTVYHMEMFANCTNLSSTANADGTLGRGGATNDFRSVFSNCTSLTDMGGYNAIKSPFSNASSGQDFTFCFSGCSNIVQMPYAINYNSRNSALTMEGMFQDCEFLGYSSFSIWVSFSKVTDMSAMFINCKRMSAFEGRVVIPGQVRTTYRMFYYCSNLTSIGGRLVNDNVSSPSLQDAHEMFGGSGVKKLPANLFYGFQALTNASRCFADCKSLTGFESKRSYRVEPASYYIKTVYVNNFLQGTQVSYNNVTLDLSEMFIGCSNLVLGRLRTAADSELFAAFHAGGGYIGKIKTDRMFYNCSKLGAPMGAEIQPNKYTNLWDTTGTSRIVSHSLMYYGTDITDQVPSGWK